MAAPDLAQGQSSSEVVEERSTELAAHPPHGHTGLRGSRLQTRVSGFPAGFDYIGVRLEDESIWTPDLMLRLWGHFFPIVAIQSLAFGAKLGPEKPG